MRLRLGMLWGFLALVGLPAAGTAQVNKAPDLKGVIELHAHVAPETTLLPFRRSLDAIEAAQIARIYGMRAMVLKEHNGGDCFLGVPGVSDGPGHRALRGIVLNRATGGINPVAVESMALLRGGRRGRVVYMPTVDSEYYNPGSPNAVPVASKGQLLPAVLEVLKVMAKHNLGLSTGHSSPEESLLLIRAAKQIGINQIYVQHPTDGRIKMSMATLKEAIGLGRSDRDRAEPGGPHGQEACGYSRAWSAERRNNLRSGPARQRDPRRRLPGGPACARERGLQQAEIDTMVKTNPARFLGLK